MAKCNLGKVKFKTMPVSGRPMLRLRGDLFELSAGGASWFALHLLACLLACVKGHFARSFSSLFRLLYYQARFFPLQCHLVRRTTVVLFPCLATLRKFLCPQAPMLLLIHLRLRPVCRRLQFSLRRMCQILPF